MGAADESISSPDHETLGLLEPPEDQSVVAAQKPRLSYAGEEIGAILQIINENRDGLVSKEELMAVHHEFHPKGDGRLPAQEPAVCLPQGVGAIGSGVAGSQLQASSTVFRLPDVICCDAGGTKKQNSESNLETMLAKVGGVRGSSAEDGAATAVGGDSFDGAGVNGDGAATAVGRDNFGGAGVKDNGDGAATAAVGGDSFDRAGVKDNGDGAAIVGDGGGVSRSVLMCLGWNFDIIWALLIRGMNLVKAGSFVLCLLSFFIDKQLSFSSKDTLYLIIAFVCSLLAFFVAPWHVPDANATLRAQGMQEIAVRTLLMGVLTVMVTALDDEFRVPVLACCLALIHIGQGLEED